MEEEAEEAEEVEEAVMEEEVEERLPAAKARSGVATGGKGAALKRVVRAATLLTLESSPLLSQRVECVVQPVSFKRYSVAHPLLALQSSYPQALPVSGCGGTEARWGLGSTNTSTTEPSSLISCTVARLYLHVYYGPRHGNVTSWRARVPDPFQTPAAQRGACTAAHPPVRVPWYSSLTTTEPSTLSCTVARLVWPDHFWSCAYTLVIVQELLSI
eukprot:7566540-Pyramimonas_sp.AAC.1